MNEYHFADREQRELYEAAKVIQNAFRQYKQRIISQKQTATEIAAAITIQSYYRRYKQVLETKQMDAPLCSSTATSNGCTTLHA